MKLFELEKPRAITMWDFSWLERRWDGAGYEDPAKALDELVERGYNAVRIDAYPHLVAESAEKEWTLKPAWLHSDWGAPATCKIQIQPALNEFIRMCADRDVMVGLSSWFQRVEEYELINIFSPQKHAEIWKKTLDSIDAAGLMDSILYVDFCNEWPFKTWAPFFKPGDKQNTHWAHADSIEWMKASVASLRKDYPNVAMTYSYVGKLRYSEDQMADIQAINDFLEPHLWMVQANGDEFYNRFGGYHYPKWEPSGYQQVAKYAEPLYRQDPEYWHKRLEEHIDLSVQQSIDLNRGLITTECWGIVEWKDWPGMDWGWVKECCAHGVRYASSKGRWITNATSNFCGPQFVGMWRDVEWHQEMTEVIKSAPMPSLNSAIDTLKV